MISYFCNLCFQAAAASVPASAKGKPDKGVKKVPPGAGGPKKDDKASNEKVKAWLAFKI
jgi:hypothetical protein